jgi:hypothetical protein
MILTLKLFLRINYSSRTLKDTATGTCRCLKLKTILLTTSRQDKYSKILEIDRDILNQLSESLFKQSTQ